jgi:hypothetical protein
MTILPESVWVFLGLSVVLFGGAAFMMGQALAETWRPIWQTVPYGILLALAARFMTYALFGADLLSITGLLASVAVILALAFTAFQLARARAMVAQYPWLYEPDGPFGWREKGGAGGG